MKQKIWSPDCLSELCEDICVGALGSNYVSYIATNHQLFGLDIRKGFSQRWTHGIPSSPSILKVVKHAGLYVLLLLFCYLKGDFNYSRLTCYFVPEWIQWF